MDCTWTNKPEKKRTHQYIYTVYMYMQMCGLGEGGGSQRVRVILTNFMPYPHTYIVPVWLNFISLSTWMEDNIHKVGYFKWEKPYRNNWRKYHGNYCYEIKQIVWRWRKWYARVKGDNVISLQPIADYLMWRNLVKKPHSEIRREYYSFYG